MNNTGTQLETDRLCLRPPTLDDTETLVTAIDHPDIARNTLTIPYPYTVEDAREFVSMVASQEDASEAGERTFAVTLKDSGDLIGMCGFEEPSWGRTEMGYWISSAYWSKGYATEAARRLIRYIFETTDVYRVQAEYFAFNLASRRVQEKAGMTFEGIRRGHVTKNGEHIDTGMCVILRPEWEAQNR